MAKRRAERQRDEEEIYGFPLSLSKLHAFPENARRRFPGNTQNTRGVLLRMSSFINYYRLELYEFVDLVD